MGLDFFGSIRARPTTASASLPFSKGKVKVAPSEATASAKSPTTVTVTAPNGVASIGDFKRDSGLEQTISSGGSENGPAMNGDEKSLKVIASPREDGRASKAPSIAPSEVSTRTSGSRWRIRSRNGNKARERTPPIPSTDDNESTLESSYELDFSPLTASLPDMRLDFINQVSFSTRGSVLLGGRRAVNDQAKPNTEVAVPEEVPTVVEPPPHVPVLSEEVAKESLKVRSMYEDDLATDWVNVNSISQPEILVEDEATTSDDVFNVHLRPRPQTARAIATKRISVLRREHELAGGIEDWEDVRGGDVDRYGFIVQTAEADRSGTPEPRPPRRVSTSLRLASQAPRKQRGFGGQFSTAQSPNSGLQIPEGKASAKSLKTQNSTASHRSFSARPLRTLANRLPGNQDRRWMDEAGDMLTLPHGLADIAEAEEGITAAEATKKNEWSRSEKWRRMAKVVKSGPDGEGMEFEFEVANPKLIERTWKGIPDCWRATAWRCFLNASAKKVQGSPSDASLIAAFQSLVYQGCADDVQIDMDVPRTINSHIMFRKRYRGGQRLLFRVLHCLALYFPDTGYVQGMASLAATLLCYYDEERTFVMCVRLWTLRGLDKLYAHGFAGLMAALDEFQADWMRGHDVSRQLDELEIGPTAYGTRWYLTLFNYSIPFAAQLRVWDVFMLLGDADTSVLATPERPFRHGLDVLHACSCALIDGTREILLDSDFDNAMKVLTSWVPIKDESLFMRVAKAEWKMRQKRRT